MEYNKKFGTILADPPWQFRSPRAIVGNGGRGSSNISSITQVDVTMHYPTMPLDDLKKIPVRLHVANNSHLYLSTTNSFMVEAHKLAKSWGFNPKTILTWAKVRQDDPTKASCKTSYWYRSATEHIIFAVRGKQRLLQNRTRPTPYMHPRLPHSVKPDMFYDLIEENSPGPYLELFARRYRSGWDRWRNEVTNTVDLYR